MGGAESGTADAFRCVVGGGASLDAVVGQEPQRSELVLRGKPFEPVDALGHRPQGRLHRLFGGAVRGVATGRSYRRAPAPTGRHRPRPRCGLTC